MYDVYVFAFLLGMATAVDNPTRQAFVSELVGGDELPNAVGLNSATFNAARIVGPAVAGLLIEGVGTAWVFLGNAASFIAVIAGLLLMRPAELFPAPRLARQRGNVREGLSYVRQRRELLVPIVLVGIVGTFGHQLPDHPRPRRQGRVPPGRGRLRTALARSSPSERSSVRCSAPGGLTRRRGLVILAALAFGLLELGVGLMPSFSPCSRSRLVPLGLVDITFSTAANSSVQLASAPEMRGRVMGLYMLVFVGGTPLGAPLGGLGLPGVRCSLGPHRRWSRERRPPWRGAGVLPAAGDGRARPQAVGAGSTGPGPVTDVAGSTSLAGWRSRKDEPVRGEPRAPRPGAEWRLRR